ncbi:MAG: ribosome maturation factor RimM [Clostridiales bacterium]|nr:ribosome maturation factor RimM [Clostridiales bacterium]
MANSEYTIQMGKIINTHALKGEVKCLPWGDSITFENMTRCCIDGIEREIEQVRYFKNKVILKFKGIDSIEQAELLKGKILYADRDSADNGDGRPFLVDVIGQAVRDEHGEEIGKIQDFMDNPAHIIFIVKLNNGKEVLVPNVDEFVKEKNAEGGYVVMDIKRLMDI